MTTDLSRASSIPSEGGQLEAPEAPSSEKRASSKHPCSVKVTSPFLMKTKRVLSPLYDDAVAIFFIVARL